MSRLADFRATDIDGVDHGLEHEDVMHLYAAWDARLGLRLDGAGLGSVEALAEDMRRRQTLSLWWD